MGPVKVLTVPLETVTPLFLGGANPRDSPELRPPSIRGALRYWLRAALGGVIGDDVQGVREAEAAVFGSTDETTGGASSVTIRVRPDRDAKPETFRKQKPALSNESGQPRRQPTGRDYLFWSMGESGRVERGNYQRPKQYFVSGTTFDLVLSARYGARNADTAFEQAVASLWLLIHLGGIGSRSRRAGGSLSVRQPLEAEGLQFLLPVSTVNQAVQQLSAGLGTIRNRLSGRACLSARPAFDILHPEVCRVWVLGSWRSPEAAVEAIGAALRDFRSRREPDHSSVAKWLQGHRILTVERAAFGLPIPYRYSDGGPSATIQGVRGDHRTYIERRASPLWLKVSKAADGAYIGVATLFKSAFLPEHASLTAKQQTPVPPIDPPQGYALIEDWVATCFSASQEVYYD